jgi:hypothetical protein
LHTVGYPRESESFDFWREPAAEIEVGDVFVQVPQLSLGPDAVAVHDEEGAIYLATERVELALLIKMLRASWWFVPVLTAASFGDQNIYQDVVEETNWGKHPGTFVAPPLQSEAYPPLNAMSVIFTLRPTIHRPDAFEDAQSMRVASLTPWAYKRVVRVLVDGFVDA